MNRRHRLCWVLAFAAGAGMELPSIAREPDRYLNEIKPILRERCYACHGALEQKSGLRVDTAQQMIDADILQSGELLARLTHEDSDVRMPPEGAPLSLLQIAAIRDWIEAGAPAPSGEKPEDDPAAHWSFQRIERPQPPVRTSANPVDSFLAAKHTELYLHPQPQAESGILLRRLYLNLTGLPPTLKQLAHEDEFEQIVDRLLASPHYGERWGRHWMDVWRYSDWFGLGDQLRNSQKHIWRWRDWIVNSLNEDKGYDRMILEMLAGDELDPTNPDVVVGTGYLARNYYLFNRTTWLDDTIEHTGKAFLGLTINCAKCHDHKFDPISQVDYYRFRAIFEPHQIRLDAIPGQTDFERDGLPRAFDDHLDAKTWLHVRGNPADPDKTATIEPGVPECFAGFAPEPQSIELPLSAWAPGLREYVQKDQFAAAEQKLQQASELLKQARLVDSELTSDSSQVQKRTRKPEVDDSQPESSVRNEVALAEARFDEARAGLQSLRARIAADNTILRGTGQGEPSTAVQLEREHAVTAAKVNVLTAKAGDEDAVRKALTAAEMVLHEPLHTNYSSLRGSFKALETPEHTEPQYSAIYAKTSTGRRTSLARWITARENPLTARVAVNHIWLRHFGRPLVETVFDFGRRASRPELADLLDFLAAELMDSGWSMKHVHRLILTSEAWRRSSSSLHCDADTLATDPENRFYWRMNSRRMESQIVRDATLHVAGRLDLTQGGPAIDPKPEARRRSLYFKHSRDQQSLFLAMFDDAEILACYRRNESVVPQQALAMANSRLTLEMSEATPHVIGEQHSNQEFASKAFLHVLCRRPTSEELAECTEFLKQVQSRARLIHALLNHNDYLMIR